jgi:EAL domain-containing protein (putative c-di-GMP-specific phosphodiesterase class I)
LLARSDRDAAVVRATVAFARALELHVTAEGVETDEQLAILADMGCDRAQGFLICRPLAAESITGILGELSGTQEPAAARRSRGRSASA